MQPLKMTDYDYDELIESMEVDRLVEVSDADYQGDTRMLLRQGERYGVLTFGWGSCSGCDALQACNTVEEVTALRDQLWNDIVWQDTPAAMRAYLTQKDWSLEYMSGDETDRFVRE
jgi:hypothetical protein